MVIILSIIIILVIAAFVVALWSDKAGEISKFFRRLGLFWPYYYLSKGICYSILYLYYLEDKYCYGLGINNFNDWLPYIRKDYQRKGIAK